MRLLQLLARLQALQESLKRREPCVPPLYRRQEVRRPSLEDALGRHPILMGDVLGCGGIAVACWVAISRAGKFKVKQ